MLCMKAKRNIGPAAKCFIDATGDGDLAAMAGVPMNIYDQPLQPVSLCFILGGVKADSIENIHHSRQGVNYYHPSLRKKLLELAAEETIPNFGGPWMCYMLNDEMVLVNITRTEAQLTDEREQTRAECQLREDAHKLVDILKKHCPQFQDAYIVATATQAGARETRHIEGMHTLTGDEYIDGVHFPDSIARGAHPIDIHDASSLSQNASF